VGIFLVCIMLMTSFLVVFPVEKVKATGITFYPTDDTCISKDKPDEINGPVIDMAVRNTYGAGGSDIWEWDSLIKFDISDIPSDTMIVSATLKLYYYAFLDNNPAGRSLNLYRIISDWNEETTNWINQPSYASQPTSNVIVPSSYDWMNWDVTNDVKSFIDGTNPNYGWDIKDENYWGYYDIPVIGFQTKEYGSYIPYLEIELNNPPNKPSRPVGPPAGWVGCLIEFSTNATDPDNGQINYGWDWNGDDTVEQWTSLMQSGDTCTRQHKWDNPGTYNIKVKAKNIYGAVSNWSDIKTIQILIQNENQPPNIPTNPNPANNAINVDINTNLSWTGGDPDAGDTVTYDVYFGSMPPIQKIASNISTITISPGTLSNCLTYFWNVVAWDNNGLSTDGPWWDFTTINITNNPPSKPSKPIGQINGTKGISYLYTSNTTDPDGDQVYYLWDWGDDSFSQWLGPLESGEITNALHSWAKGSYNIRVKAKDIYGLESEWSYLLSIRMPKKYIYNPIVQLLFKMLERFPFFEKILNQ
ncbi:MAG: DNRLRE domain-containing protein, partial [Candidatus Thermoplasmatota archaeon]|nr:DNRLRE domain-containing protein [Candidatus Thermoplasmatota archaeon]